MKRALAVAALLISTATAHAHGGLPVSQHILRQNGGDTMYVPVVYWGLWVGKAGGPWTWICEELINNYRFRRFALSIDGVFYTTNQQGVTLSTDHGCTWTSATGPVANLATTDIVADPVDGMTAYVSTGDGGTATDDGGIIPASNAVFVTHDHGTTWTPLAGLTAESSRIFQSVRIAPSNPQILYVTSVASTAPFAAIVHRSADAGMTFADMPLDFQLAGIPPQLVEVLTIDPRNPDVVYARGIAMVGDVLEHALLESTDGGQTFTQLLEVDGVTEPSGQTRGIDDVAIDVAAGKVYVATRVGLYEGEDATGGAPMTMVTHQGSLMQTQCVDVHGGALFACASQFVDHAAIAESTDGAKTFKSVLNYVDTVGPVDCPTSTPVGSQCPAYWYMYGSQLGIGFDAGAPDGSTMMKKPAPGCSCGVGGAGAAGGGIGAAMLLAFAGIGGSRMRRRRHKNQPSRNERG
jgi:MYXO-CTERM domain-containing protein